MSHEEALLIIAINEAAVNTVTEMMLGLMGEYLEGEIDTSGHLFNKYFPKLNREMQTKIIHQCPWERVANHLANRYNIPEPWRIKDPEKPWTWEYKGFERNPQLGWEAPKLKESL